MPTPFIDSDKDGLPDVDESGRFKTTDNSLAPSPFPFPGAASETTRDAAGRAMAGAGLLYEYLDTSHTFAAQMMKDLKPLVNPKVEAKHETLMDTIGGMDIAVGPRVAKTKSYAGGKTIEYQGISQDSPMLDLVYAMGVILSDRNTDSTLALGRELFTTKAAEMARVTGAMSKAFDIAQKHTEAKLPRTATFWDESLDAVAKIAREPGLLEDLLKALADPQTAQLGTIFSNYAKFRDDISYDPAQINGEPWNVTTKSSAQMNTPVDRSKPETGKNRSALYRFLGLISDTSGVTACNKPDAVVHAELGGISIPSFGLKWKECQVFKIENLSAFYLDSIANASQYDTGDVKRGTIYMRPSVLRLASGPDLIENSSGIQGMWPARAAPSRRPRSSSTGSSSSIRTVTRRTRRRSSSSAICRASSWARRSAPSASSTTRNPAPRTRTPTARSAASATARTASGCSSAARTRFSPGRTSASTTRSRPSSARS